MSDRVMPEHHVDGVLSRPAGPAEIGAGRRAASAADGPGFAVFLSHNSRDKPAVERLAERLQREGLEPWLDSWCLTSGRAWQDELAAGVEGAAAFAYFVGPASRPRHDGACLAPGPPRRVPAASDRCRAALRAV